MATPLQVHLRPRRRAFHGGCSNWQGVASGFLQRSETSSCEGSNGLVVTETLLLYHLLSSLSVSKLILARLVSFDRARECHYNDVNVTKI